MELSKLKALKEAEDRDPVAKAAAWAELKATVERFHQRFEPIRAEIDALPEHEQRNWNEVPLYLLGEGSYYRSLLRRDVNRALHPGPNLSTRLLQRARGTSRMQRTTRRRSSASRDGPSDEPDLAGFTVLTGDSPVSKPTPMAQAVLGFNDLLREARETLDADPYRVLLWIFYRRLEGERRFEEQRV